MADIPSSDVEAGVAKLSVADATADVQSAPEDDAEESELLLFHSKECYVYKIPPRMTSGSYRADEWNINKWAWEGSLRVVSQGDFASIRLEDSKTGELFAIAPVRAGQPAPVEAVIDSSRFFVLRIEDTPPEAAPGPKGKKADPNVPPPHARHAFVGLGFRERPAAFDFQEAVYDHVKYVRKKREAQALGQRYESRPAADLRLKEGQTLHLSIKTPAARPKSSILFAASPHTPGHLAFPPPPEGQPPPTLLRNASGDHSDGASESSGARSSGSSSCSSSPEGSHSAALPKIAPPPPPGAKSPVLASKPGEGSPSTPPVLQSDDDFGDFVSAK